jgi:AP2-like factor (ANT lineage)
VSNYTEEIKAMQEYSPADWVCELRRRSSGFSRGVSAYRGVTSHKGKNSKGKWEARIGRVMGNKYLYLGTYPTERAAAEAYDCAALLYRDSKAVTNFDRSNYSEEEIANAGLGAKIL